MVYSLTYRRPTYVPKESRPSFGSDSDRSDEGSLRSGKSSIPPGVPEALAFDKIISNGACPPCTVRDFMNYMTYIEHSAENLKFFLWLREYGRRFEQISATDKALAPEWTSTQHETVLAAIPVQSRVHRKNKIADEMFKGTDFEESKQQVFESVDPFGTPPHTPGDMDAHRNSEQPWNRAQSVMTGSVGTSAFPGSTTESHRVAAGEAFEAAGLKAPFTIQPFRDEINRIIGTYIVKDAVCELNISSRERTVLLKALEHTTHPSAFREVNKGIESSLRRQSHPNFIRWTICNGNKARVIFARGLGISLIIMGICLAVLLTLSKLSRGYRVIPIALFILGAATLIAAWKGMCVVLHGMHHRHLRPWELFEDPESEVQLKKDSFDSFPDSHSYEDEPWVIKYQKRNVIRKIFDREVWIEEPALRQIQDTIFIQSILCAVLFGGVITGIFVAVPGGGFF